MDLTSFVLSDIGPKSITRRRCRFAMAWRFQAQCAQCGRPVRQCGSRDFASVFSTERLTGSKGTRIDAPNARDRCEQRCTAVVGFKFASRCTLNVAQVAIYARAQHLQVAPS